MLAELYLRVAADLGAAKSLTAAELGELLAESVPPLWVFTEAVRRRHDAGVMGPLFAHPEAPRELLREAVASDPKRRERFDHHVSVYTGPPPTLKAVLSQLIPEGVAYKLTPDQEVLLVEQLSAHCLHALRPSLRYGEARAVLEAQLVGLPSFCPGLYPGTMPRQVDPWTPFLLLGDFLHYLTCSSRETEHDLPVLARVALALNNQQPVEEHLADADVRVRAAAAWRQRSEDGTRAKLA